MKKIFYLHFHEAELKERVKSLSGIKAKFSSHWSTEETAKFADVLPDIFIVSLDRLPSHGRQYVNWLWEAKKRQHIPVIFTGGKTDKVKETRAKFPNAIYCTAEELPALLKKVTE